MAYEVANGRGSFAAKLTGGTATSAGGVASIPNPEGVDLLITRAFLHVATNSTGATNLTAGTAPSGTVTSNSLLTNTALAAAAGSALVVYSPGTAIGGAGVKWGSNDYLNVQGSASSVGFTGTLYLDYFRLG